MVQLAHSGTNIEKVAEILDAAQNRFGSYGFEKTTMNEIALDMGISKAALYYYYPDKESLYRAVIEKETEVYLSMLCEKINATDNPVEKLHLYIDIRLDYFRKLLNLTRVRLEDNQGVKNIMNDLRLRFREKEKEKIVEIINQGIEQGIFAVNEVENVAVLFLDTLRGLSLVYRKTREITYFTEEDYASYKNQLNQFVNIFIKGISK